MSGHITVVGGVNSGASTLSGIVTVPASGLAGQATAQASLQSLVNTVDDRAVTGSVPLTNFNAVASVTSSFNTSVTGGGIYEITNADSLGNVSAGVASVNVTIPNAFNYVVVQAPGAVSVSGNGQASGYLIGSGTDAVISTNGSGSGTNTIAGLGGNSTVYANGNNEATYTGGKDLFKALAGSDTVIAAGNATVRVGVPTDYAAKVDFINVSSAQAVVLGNAGAVTAFGGNAGGLFYGGTSGNNSLIGGNGAVTLVGGNNNDLLAAGAGDATISSGANYLFAGAGNETLTASSVTGTNLFQAGTGGDVMTSDGTGTQYFFAGSGSSTMTGSSITGAQNVYYFGGSLTGGNDVIMNYSTTSDQVNILNGQKIAAITSVTAAATFPQGGTLVTLSDNTQITLAGVNSSKFSQNSVGTTSLTTA